ncbi:hypothetical protein EDD22DRAFT_940142, partial [Suillus occidentalis]
MLMYQSTTIPNHLDHRKRHLSIQTRISPPSLKAVKILQALVPSLRCSISLSGRLLTLLREALESYPQRVPTMFSSSPLTTSHLQSMDSRSSSLSSHSISTAQSSPVSPLVFANMSSFPGQQPQNLDLSHDLHLSDSPTYIGNMTFTFDSHARRSSNVSAIVTEKAEKRLGLDAQLSNEDRARTVSSRPFTSAISTANSINAPIVDIAPRPIPSKRIWSRIQHTVTKTFSKRSDS